MIDLPFTRWEYMGYKPNQWGLDHVHQCETRFGFFVTCRQCGKSVTASMEIDRAMTEPPDEYGRPPFVGLLAPTYEKAEITLNKYVTAVRAAFGHDYVQMNQNKHRLRLPHNGAELIWMSADDPQGDAGKGYTFSFLLVDEGQDVPDIVMDKILPALDVRNAPMRAFGTPDITPQQTWFKGGFKLGQNPDYKDYSSFTLSAYDNPWTTLEAIETAKARLPEREFKMLYLGQWVDETGGPFEGYQNAVYGDAENEAPKPGIRYVMAMDFAMLRDFNVLFVAEESTKRIVAMYRWPGTSVQASADKVQSLREEWNNPMVTVDTSGAGNPFAEELRLRNITTRGITFNSANKMEIIRRLAGALEHRRLMIKPFPILLSELDGYVYKQTPSGRLTAEAAYGFHDDTIQALMLMNEALRSAGGDRTQYDYSGERNTAAALIRRQRERPTG